MFERRGDKGDKMFWNKCLFQFDVNILESKMYLPLSSLRADEVIIAINVLKESAELSQRSNLHSLSWWKSANLTTVLDGPCV